MAHSTSQNKHLHAIVDMGSNAIRFSISDLSPPTQRILPTLFVDRASVSLFDAQHSPSGERQPIPSETISEVILAMRRFKRTCEDFSVPSSNIRVLATEATRVAINSAEFRAEIKQQLSWDVEMLSKEEEGRIGAMGVASSFRNVDGLVMDLGGGSVQLTFVRSSIGKITTGEGGSVSLPYGAAALLIRLEEAEKRGPAAVNALAHELQRNFRDAFTKVLPSSDSSIASSSSESLTLYLSGGGFRGWGSILLSLHASSPYPIPIINGFRVPASAFQDTDNLTAHVSSLGNSIFQISARRAHQVPAVAFLVKNLAAALPKTMKHVCFCQGGVREGALFSGLKTTLRAESPLNAATSPYQTGDAGRTWMLLLRALPQSSQIAVPDLVRSITTALAILIPYHTQLPKDIRPAAALRSTTTGFLAGIHGLSHEERAALGVALCERWGSVEDLSPGDKDFYERLRAVLNMREAWWAMFVGRLAALLGSVWPAGIKVGTKEERIQVRSEWKWLEKGEGLEVKLNVGEEDIAKEIKALEKLGKKKNWPGGEQGWGVRVSVVVFPIFQPTPMDF